MGFSRADHGFPSSFLHPELGENRLANAKETCQVIGHGHTRSHDRRRTSQRVRLTRRMIDLESVRGFATASREYFPNEGPRLITC